MLVAIKLKLAVVAALLAAPAMMHALAPAPSVSGTDVVEISPAAFSYRMAGDFSRAGRPVEGPHSMTKLPAKLRIMKRQVTAAEYRGCIEAGACPRVGLARDQHQLRRPRRSGGTPHVYDGFHP